MWKGSESVSNLALDFTTKCNLHCSYCYLFSKQEADRRELPVSELIDLVLETIKIFPNISMIELWGGEPTYDPERLVKFVTAMRKIGVDTWIPSTNGTRIHNIDVYEAWRFCNQKFNSQISFDGNRKYHNLYRSGSYDRVVKNIRKCILMGSHVSLRVTYPFDHFVDSISLNMNEIPDLYRQMINDKNLDNKLVDYTFAVIEYRNRKLLAIYQEIDTIFDHHRILQKAPIYRQYYMELDKIVDQHRDDDVILLPPYISDTVRELISPSPIAEPKSCGSFITQLYLHSPSSTIYPCLSQDSSEYRSLAALMNVKTKEINWPVVNTVRSFMLRRNRRCITCFMQPSCFGGCYHQVPARTNTFNAYWNTSNIPKCIFANHIFDLVVQTSKRLLNHIDKSCKQVA